MKEDSHGRGGARQGSRRLRRAPVLRPARHGQFQDLARAGGVLASNSISARHEGNAASMADAYAKATQELTLVSVHSGPGLTNALTGIGEAAKSRTPLLVLAGDVPTGAVKSNFHIEQAELVRSVGAVSERIHTPASARDDTLRAVVRALRDRQTVVLSLPTDVQDAPFSGQITPLALPPAPGPLYPDPGSVHRLADAFASAERPLILAGRGAVDRRRGGCPGRAGRAHRRPAGHLDLRAWVVCRQPLVGRHQRRLCLAGGRRIDFRERSHHRIRRQPDTVDHQARQADRARCRRRAGGRRGGQARLSDADPACRPRRRPRGRGGDPGRTGQARRWPPGRAGAARTHANASRMATTTVRPTRTRPAPISSIRAR